MDLLPNIQVDLLQEDPEPLEEEIMSDEETPEPEPQEEIIPEEDIFVEKKPKKKPEPKKEPKKKRVMTEEQLERLRKGREKALEVRRAKAKEKKELKELQSKKKKKDIQKLRDEVEDKPKPVSTPKPAEKKVLSLDDLPSDMLVELQKRAIEGYDTKRKARKEQKKKEQQHQTTINHNLGMVNNALQPQRPLQYGDAGYFRDCF